MVQTRTRDHGASNTKSQVSSRKGAKTPVVKDKKPVAKDKASAPKRDHDAAEPEEAQSSRDDGNNAQAPGTKRAKHDHGSATTQAKGAEKRKAAAASDVDSKKVQDIISKYGGLPLSDIGLSKPTEATPETILAFVLSAMLTSARISHELAYKSVKCLIEAGYHDVHTLKKSSWVERTEALTKGGYTRYREKTATALGELADFVLDEYEGDLNNLIKRADSSPSKVREMIKGIKGIGNVGTDIFFDTAQAVWPSLAPFIDPRSLKTAVQCGIGDDVDRLWQEVGKDPVEMCKLASALTTIRLEKKDSEFQ